MYQFRSPRLEHGWNQELLVAAGCGETQLPSPRIVPERLSVSLSFFAGFGHNRYQKANAIGQPLAGLLFPPPVTAKVAPH